jgi:hypothetical protein
VLLAESNLMGHCVVAVTFLEKGGDAPLDAGLNELPVIDLVAYTNGLGATVTFSSHSYHTTLLSNPAAPFVQLDWVPGTSKAVRPASEARRDRSSRERSETGPFVKPFVQLDWA